ncbi:MAG: tRNA-binding protein [Candidatus Daviesbacteria bacterium]|nr:tRNA-binding protein [Candidatus Daviesbacteria bacterium]
MIKPQITFEDFEKIDIRVGRVIKVEDFPEARKPLYKITVDFGEELGIKHSAVGATHLYKKEQLQDKLILGLVNMPPKQIGPFTSEFLTLGVSDEEDHCILIVPDKKAPLGDKLY